MKKHSSHYWGRKFWKKFSLKSSRSAPNLSSENSNRNSQLMEKRKTISSLTNIKSAVVVHPRTIAQESHEHLDVMNRMVDETDQHLRQALEHAAVRHEQLDELHNRSEEMLHKNENLVFGITNYRKSQERDLFWRRFQYTAFGVITIGVIILLIILSMTSKRSNTSSQILDVRYSNADLRNQIENEKKSNLTVTDTRRRRRRTREIVLS